MLKKIITMASFLPLFVYANNHGEAQPPVSINGFSITVGSGYWNMKGDDQDLYDQTDNKSRTSYTMLYLSYMYNISREDWQDIHYGFGFKLYDLIRGSSSVPLLMPQVSATKYISNKFSLGASFATQIWLYDFGINAGYNLTKNIKLKLGANYTPSTTIFDHDHDINAYSISLGIQYTF